MTPTQSFQTRSKMTLSKMALFSPFALMIGGVQSAHAQQASVPASPGTDGTYERDDDSKEITVTARRREERLQDVPVAATVVTGAALENLAVSDLLSITKLVPTMVVGRTAAGSGASVFLRGVGSSSISNGFDQSVSLNLDGVAMSRGRELISAQYDVQQVEVLKGPQALFFGKNSTAGVVNIASRDPGQQAEFSGRVGYEFEARQVYGEGVISGPLSDSFRARLAVRAERMDGWSVNNARANVASGFPRAPDRPRAPFAETLAGRLTLVYEPAGSNFDAKLKVAITDYKDSDTGPVERRCGFGRTAPLATFGIPEPYDDCRADGRYSRGTLPAAIAANMLLARDGMPYLNNKSHYAALTMNYTLGKLTLTSVTSQYGFDIESLTILNGATGIIGNTIGTQWDQVSQEVRLASDFDGPVNFTAGGYYAHGDFDFENGVMVTPPTLDAAAQRYHTFDRVSDFTGDSLSFFAELSWQVVPQITLAGGARWSNEKKRSKVTTTYVNPAYAAAFPLRTLGDSFSDNNVSPQATLTWKPAPNLTFYGAYKQGFKAGGFNTYLAIAPTTTAADARFDSELVKGFEFGARTQWLDGRVTANLTAFSYKFTNLQVAVLNPVILQSITTNAGSLTSKGAELEFSWRDIGVRGLDLHAQAAYTDARYGNYVGQCYTGQTVVAGCNRNQVSSGAYTAQTYSGRTAPKAPKWVVQGGVKYDMDLMSGLRAGFNFDISYSSRYNFTDTLRPDGIQNDFARIDAGISLTAPEARWKLSLIGRNLSNRWIITSGNDQIGNAGAGGTGLATGFSPDIGVIVDRGRQVYLELGTKF